MMKPMLQIQDLTKRFGTKTAVGHLNLTVEPGDIYGFIGQNGAGKTTTIRAVVGVMPFDAGEIRIDGHSVREEPVLCKSVTAYIPDNPDLYEYLTGIQYLDFIGDIFRVPADRRQKRIRKYSSLLGLTPVLGDLISSYSHGMKQKLAVLSTFLHTPKLLVLDEPFVGLDPEASYHLKAMMHELCAGGSAIFFSTHVLEVAEKLCNKIAILKDGKLIASGKTEDVRGNSSLEDVFLEVVGHES
jgi:ABC-2 type transport system ATP-binding protein